MHPPKIDVPELADAASAAAAAAAELSETIREGVIAPDSHVGTGATAVYLAEALLTALRNAHYPTPDTAEEIREVLQDCREAMIALTHRAKPAGAR